MQIPKTPRLKTSKFIESPNSTSKPNQLQQIIYNMPNKNLWFPRLEDIGCSFDFSPKNRDVLSAMYNKRKNN